MTDYTNENAAAIITAKGDEPLLYAKRLVPVDPADSGWQFSVHSLGGSDPDDIKTWAVHEVLTREPSLQQFIELPCGVILRRESAVDEWLVGAS